MSESDPAYLRDLKDLSDEALIELLSTEGDRLPRAVIDEIVRRGERMFPPLSELATDELLWWGTDPPESWVVVHATFALYATGLPSAVEPLLGALRLACETGSDWVTDAARELFSRIGPACVGRLREVYRDEDEERAVRVLCLGAMIALSLQQEDLQVELVQTLLEALSDADPVLEEIFRSWLACYFVSGHSAAILGGLGLSEDRATWPDWLQEGAEDTRDVFFGFRRDPLRFYEPEAIAKRQERWALEDAAGEYDPYDFIDSEPEDEEDLYADYLGEDPSLGYVEERPSGSTGQPFLRILPKVGRNDPCPCGAGRNTSAAASANQRGASFDLEAPHWAV